MITRATVTIAVNCSTAKWIADSCMRESMSVSGFVTHRLIDVSGSEVVKLIKQARKIKNYERMTVTIPLSVMTKVYELSKIHDTSASKLIAAELMIQSERYYSSIKNVDRDELAAISLTKALINFLDGTGGSEPQNVDGWEGVLHDVLMSMRLAKASSEVV